MVSRPAADGGQFARIWHVEPPPAGPAAAGSPGCQTAGAGGGSAAICMGFDALTAALCGAARLFFALGAALRLTGARRAFGLLWRFFLDPFTRPSAFLIF